MTLVMTLVTPYGVWSSSDHLLSDHPTNRPMAVRSAKHISVNCSDGAVLLSYAGLGRVDGRDTSQWVRGILRGFNRTVDQTLVDLCQQATASIGPIAHREGIPHYFLAGAFINGQPSASYITNEWNSVPPPVVQPEFRGYYITKIPVLLWAGATSAVTANDLKLLGNIEGKRPRNHKGYMKLLADVTRRAAESGNWRNGISRTCTVQFLPPEGHGIEFDSYGPPDEAYRAPLVFSHVLHGVDSIAADRLNAIMVAWRDSKITEEDVQRRLARAYPESVEPKYRKPIG